MAVQNPAEKTVELRTEEGGRTPAKEPARREAVEIHTVRGDRMARALGALVFVGGIAVICFVLMLGYQLYHDPNLGTITPKAPTANDIGGQIIRLVVRIALLFLGSISGSLIANKGINMYFHGLHRE